MAELVRRAPGKARPKVESNAAVNEADAPVELPVKGVRPWVGKTESSSADKLPTTIEVHSGGDIWPNTVSNPGVAESEPGVIIRLESPSALQGTGCTDIEVREVLAEGFLSAWTELCSRR